MKRLLVLFTVAVITVVILFFFTHPESLDKAWLWLIGFIGYILVLLEKGFKTLKNAFRRDKEVDPPLPSKSPLSFLDPDPWQHAHLKRLEERIQQIEQKLKDF